MQSFTKPTSDEVEAAVSLLGPASNQSYFFDRLNNPLWIGPLRERGVFDHPREPVRSTTGTAFPHWPASRYLVRMAANAPAEVTEILSQVSTTNWAVGRDVLAAAKAMPSEYSARLVPKLKELADETSFASDVKDFGEICKKLATEGKPDEAVDLMTHVFRFDWSNGKRHSSHDDPWFIKTLNDELLPAIVSVRPAETIEHLLNELQRSIEASGASSPGENDRVHRPFIEEHEANLKYDTQSSLVGCVRSAIELAVRAGRLSLADALAAIGKRDFVVLQRMRLHLLRLFGDHAPADVRRAILDHQLFGHSRYQHEYELLVRERFAQLAAAERAQWIEWIDQGPEGVDARYFHPDENADDRREQRERWQYHRLLWIQESLDSDRRNFVESMKARVGEPKTRELGRARFVDYASPVTAAELSNHSFSDVVELLSDWRQPIESVRFEGPSYGGLKREFQAYCRTVSVEASRQAALMCQRPAMYVRAFIDAMRDAVKEGQQIDIQAVLFLCQWVVAQPVTENTSPRGADEYVADPSWQWTWDAVAEFCKTLCEIGAPMELRYDVWKTVAPLFTGQIGSSLIEMGEDRGVWQRDFLNSAINAPQGKAMEAAMTYLRWVANALAGADPQNGLAAGLNTMSEVRDVLDHVLSRGPGVDGVATSAVLGANTGLLYWIDRNWLKDNCRELFCIESVDIERKTIAAAAWNSYLVWTNPHFGTYGLLRDQFSVAVDRVAHVVEPEKDEYYSPPRHLAEHIITLFGRGQLSLDDDKGIVKRLLRYAVLPIRSHAIEFVGRMLYGDEHKEEIPPEVLQRFIALWDWYWSEIGKDDARANPNLSVFGLWFASGAFPNSWSLDQLYAVVSVAPRQEPDDLIVEHLAKIASTKPKKAVQTLQLMVGGAGEAWRIYGSRDDAREILRIALSSGKEARQIAEVVIRDLGRKGFHEFGDLLK